MKKKSIPKNTKHNTKKRNVFSPWTQFYIDIYAGNKIPVNAHYLDQLALELANWAWKNRNNYECVAENAITLQDFYYSKGIGRQSFYNFVARNPNLKEARDNALEIIGAHRERGGLWRKIDPALVSKTMSKYDASERKLEKWRTKLKTKVLNAQANLNNSNNKEYIVTPEPKKPVDESKK